MSITVDEAKAAYFKTGSAYGAAKLLGTTRYTVVQLLKGTGVLQRGGKRKTQKVEDGMEYVKECLNLKVGQKIKVFKDKESSTKVRRYLDTAVISEIYPNFIVIKNELGIRSCYTYGELYALYSGGGEEKNE